jgi:hypothetical protein
MSPTSRSGTPMQRNGRKRSPMMVNPAPITSNKAPVVSSANAPPLGDITVAGYDKRCPRRLVRRATSYKYALGTSGLRIHREGHGVSNATVALQDIAIPFQTFPTMTILTLFLIGLYLAFLLIGLWVYQDARIRGMNALFWLAVVFLVPIFGLVGYVIYGRERAV